MKTSFTILFSFYSLFIFGQTPLSFHSMDVLVANNGVGDEVVFENVTSVNGLSVDLYATVIESSDIEKIESMIFSLDMDDDFKFMLKDKNVAQGNELWAKVKYRFEFAHNANLANLDFNIIVSDLDKNYNTNTERVTAEELELSAYCTNNPSNLVIDDCSFTGSTNTNAFSEKSAVMLEYVSLNSFTHTYTVKKNVNQAMNSAFFIDGNENLVDFVDIDRVVVEPVLPIELMTFNAEKLENNKVQILWETATELNASHFIVEVSNNSQIFKSVGHIDATNNLAGYNYSMLDLKPFNGINYYRLKMVDLDGSYTYSEIKGINLNLTSALALNIQVFPNPSIEYVNVTASEKLEHIKIFSPAGQMVKSTSESRINLQNMEAGLYTMVCSTKYGEVSKQLIISK